MAAAECRHSADIRVTIGLMRRRRFALGDPSAEFLFCSRHRRVFLRQATHRLLTVVRPGRHGKTAVALEVAEELNLILKPMMRSFTLTNYEPLCLAQTGPRARDVPAPR